MNNTPFPAEGLRHAWAERSAEDLPKRPAEERVRDFCEVHRNFTPEDAQAQAERCVQCVHPGCVEQCPVSSPVEQWMQLVAEGRFLEAAEVAREANAIPEICARLCPRDHLCEQGCVLGGPSDPVRIGALEQFLQDYSLGLDGVDDRLAPPNGRKIAVVGAGAAGLACADELSRRGFSVTLFDAGPHPGGSLVRETAPFRLDPAVVARRVEVLRGRGVEFRLTVDLGVAVTLASLRGNFDAVFVGLEAHRARALHVPGTRLEGVSDGLALMAGVTAGSKPDWSGCHVVVVGDEDLAVDCARSAMRCGAASSMVLVSTEEAQMPCGRREVDDAREEGVRFAFGRVPVSLHGDSNQRVTGVESVKVSRLAREDARGSTLGLEAGTECLHPADRVVVALGFERPPSALPGDFVDLGSDGLGEVLVDKQQMTHLAGVFAGGEVVRGPCDVVHAIRDARQAALGIERYLGVAAVSA